MPTLISATPSPYARRVRIALAEKGIDFKLQNEVPWDSTTKTPEYNPLEKLPILILDDGNAVYETHYILEYIELKYPAKKRLLSEDVDDMLLAKKVGVVVDGICDALVLINWEDSRDEAKRSKEWRARQVRKVQGGVKEVAQWVKAAKDRGDEYLVGNELGLADVAVGALCGFLDFGNIKPLVDEFSPWMKQYPEMAEYYKKIDERESFKTTRPVMFELHDKVT